MANLSIPNLSDIERTDTDVSEVVTDVSAISGRTNPSYVLEEEAGSAHPGLTKTPSDPPGYEETLEQDKMTRARAASQGDDEIVSLEKDTAEAKDQEIIDTLREVVKLCTNPNPLKRPTAKEVLNMLEAVAPPDLFEDDIDYKFDADDDDDDEEYEAGELPIKSREERSTRKRQLQATKSSSIEK